MLAEIALQDDHAGVPGPRRVLSPQQGHGTVTAAIVDEYALVRQSEAVEDGVQAREEGREPGLLVIHGDYDAK
jgi:hypothetical protein